MDGRTVADRGRKIRSLFLKCCRGEVWGGEAPLRKFREGGLGGAKPPRKKSMNVFVVMLELGRVTVLQPMTLSPPWPKNRQHNQGAEKTIEKEGRIIAATGIVSKSH